MSRRKQRYLIRFSGDLGTKKGRALVQFRSRLAKNLKGGLRARGHELSLQTTRGRLFLATGDPGAEDILARVFGIQSFSRVTTLPFSSLEGIVDDGERLFASLVEGRTFAVRARRSSIREQVPFTSEAIERALGARLLPNSAGVDLSHPEITVRVELTRTGAHFFDSVQPGPGGLPIGCEGKGLTLVSGGIDSVAAAWLMLKRGLQQDYLFFNLGDSAHHQQVVEVVRTLTDRWSYGSRPRLYYFDLRPWAHQIRERTETSLWQVVLKRLMLIGAQRVAERCGATAIVTGESLGQVSSQTLDNLAVIEAISALPVLRPLLGFDKSEIIDLARRIGTFELSAKVQEYCALQGRGPTASADPEAVAQAEARLDVARLEQEIAAARYLNLGHPRLSEPDAASDDSLAVDRVPDGCTIIDLRSAGVFENWHYPGALRLSYDEALRSVSHVDPDKIYVVCCEVEFKSADVAEKLRAAGRQAHYFRGGTAQLLRYAAERHLVLAASVSPAVR